MRWLQMQLSTYMETFFKWLTFKNIVFTCIQDDPPTVRFSTWKNYKFVINSHVEKLIIGGLPLIHALHCCRGAGNEAGCMERLSSLPPACACHIATSTPCRPPTPPPALALPFPHPVPIFCSPLPSPDCSPLSLFPYPYSVLKGSRPFPAWGPKLGPSPGP